jgi:hypothetical protein
MVHGALCLERWNGREQAAYRHLGLNRPKTRDFSS